MTLTVTCPGCDGGALCPTERGDPLSRTPVVTVVVPAHQEGQILGSQLAALSAQLGAPPHDVVVVLNRASDRTRTTAESFAHDMPLRIVHADRVASVAYARNVGASLTEAPYLLFCDADDTVGRDWIANLSAPLLSGNVDFVGGAPTVERRGLASWAYRWYYASLDGPHLAFMAPGTWFPIGASIGIRHDRFLAVGGFDEGFPAAGYEDVDLARRLYADGCRVGLAPDARFRYATRKTFRSLMRQQRAYARGLAYLTTKEGRPLYRPGHLRRLAHVTRVALGTVRHRRANNPAEFAATVLEQWFRYDANWCYGTEAAARAPDMGTDEFVVLPDRSVIGGLSFVAPVDVSRRRNWQPDSAAEALSLTLMERLTAVGDTVVEWRAGVGAFAIAAALHAGPTGRVIAVEPDPRLSELCEANAARHRVADRITVRRDLALNSEHPVQLFRAGAWAVGVELLDAAQSVLEANRDAALVVGVDTDEPGPLTSWIRTLLERVEARASDAWFVGVSGGVARRTAGALVVLPRARVVELADFAPAPYGEFLTVG